MTWVVPLALGGVAIIVMAVFTMLSAHKRHRAIVAPSKTAGPRVLVHDINDDRCTGCDACVSVCPTNVLDLVANKSRVLRFHDCIQCEACMFACPTEALVMFPEGSTPPVLKVPEIDENFQTAVKGQYLIGEVAGKPLVKNAANLGRAVIEHMLASGLTPGALGSGETNVDVAIVGSGPGGVSAALTCIQKGLSYVVLEKEQMIASTISRYPKGKLVMAEPYDTQNLSLLPVFDSGKEQLIPIWREVIERVGMTIKLGESVETVALGKDSVFDVKTTVAAYRAQRMVLSIGTRGKPRTLQVPGENMPKVYSLLEDPDDWKGKSVLVVGGGDSACEAALALADAGAKVMISYRGKGFNRAAPKNKQAIESYAAQSRINSKLGSQILNFEAETVTLALADGTQKVYPNDATFVLIGADPPVQWLEKMGVKFVERPHQYQLGKTDDMVKRFVALAVECPEDGARAAAQVLGGSIGIDVPAVPAPSASAALTMAMATDEPVSGPRKWLRSATSIFSTRSHSGLMPMPQPPAAAVEGARSSDGRLQRAKRFEAPVPLSEFAKRNNKSGVHSRNGRRDALSAGERTRILRMLRDEGGRMADEDSRVELGADPGGNAHGFDLADSPGPAPTAVLPDVPAKPAVVVGLAQAQAARSNNKRPAAQGRPTSPQFSVPRPAAGSHPPPASQAQAQPQPAQPQPQAQPQQASTPPTRLRQVHVSPPPPPPPPRRQAPISFGDEPTRQVDDTLLSALRNAPPAKASPKPTPPPPKSNGGSGGRVRPGDSKPPADGWNGRQNAVQAARPDEPTRIANIGAVAASRGGGGYDEPHGDGREGLDGAEEMTRPADDFRSRRRMAPPPPPGSGNGAFEDHRDPEEATRLVDGIATDRAHNHGPSNDERTRAVNIRNDPSISDIDWDLD